jgi:hypothetical protein
MSTPAGTTRIHLRTIRGDRLQSMVSRLQHLLLEDPLDDKGMRVIVRRNVHIVGDIGTRFLDATSDNAMTEGDLRHELRLFLHRITKATNGGTAGRSLRVGRAVRPAAARAGRIRNKHVPREPHRPRAPITANATKTVEQDPCPSEWLNSPDVAAVAMQVAARVRCPVTPSNLWQLVRRSAERLGISVDQAKHAVSAADHSLCTRLVNDIVHYITGRPALAAISFASAGSAIQPHWNAEWQDVQNVQNTISARCLGGEYLLQHRQAGSVVSEFIYRMHDQETQRLIDAEYARAAEMNDYAEWFEWLRSKMGQ